MRKVKILLVLIALAGMTAAQATSPEALEFQALVERTLKAMPQAVSGDIIWEGTRTDLEPGTLVFNMPDVAKMYDAEMERRQAMPSGATKFTPYAIYKAMTVEGATFSMSGMIQFYNLETKASAIAMPSKPDEASAAYMTIEPGRYIVGGFGKLTVTNADGTKTEKSVMCATIVDLDEENYTATVDFNDAKHELYFSHCMPDGTTMPEGDGTNVDTEMFFPSYSGVISTIGGSSVYVLASEMTEQSFINSRARKATDDGGWTVSILVDNGPFARDSVYVTSTENYRTFDANFYLTEAEKSTGFGGRAFEYRTVSNGQVTYVSTYGLDGSTAHEDAQMLLALPNIDKAPSADYIYGGAMVGVTYDQVDGGAQIETKYSGVMTMVDGKLIVWPYTTYLAEYKYPSYMGIAKPERFFTKATYGQATVSFTSSSDVVTGIGASYTVRGQHNEWIERINPNKYLTGVRVNGETKTLNDVFGSTLVMGNSYEFDFTYGTQVDGAVTATTVTTVGININSKGDMTPPKFGYLLVTDTAKVVNDTIAYADGGYVIGNFLQGSDMEVSVAPVGTDEWQSIEMDSYTYVNDLGYFCFFKLADVKEPAGSGWYKMRVKAVDEVGNFVGQDMSHAFYLTVPEPEPVNLYLRGGFNAWGAYETYRLLPVEGEENVYRLSGIDIIKGQEFKIADADYDKYNFGGVTEMMTNTKEPYTLINGTMDNCSLGETMRAGTVTFNPVTGAVTFTQESGIDGIDADETMGAPAYFDLTGRRVADPAAGVYLRVTTKADGSRTVEKVMVNP